jgi:hypothetical protein
MLVIMFSSSDEPSDVNRAYDLGVTSHPAKLQRFMQLINVVRKVEEYWRQINRCPECYIC